MKPWGGHHPATRAALESILLRTSAGQGPALLHERVLASICEFRALTANGALPKYLATAANRKLGEARFALNEIGAMDQAALVSTVSAGLQLTNSPRRAKALMISLERDLLAVGETLDKMIAGYAMRFHDAAVTDGWRRR
jgi:hypothetical protein